MGFMNGTIDGNDKRNKYSIDAVRIGKCYPGEDLEACTGGCNDKGVGNGCAECAAGESVKITIKCEGHTEGAEKTTCEGNIESQKHVL